MNFFKKHGAKMGWLAVVALVVAGLSFTSTASVVATQAVAEDSTEKLVLKGSTTVFPLADGMIAAFKQKYPGSQFDLSGGGSSYGAKGLMEGACDIANMSRPMKQKEILAAAEKGLSPFGHVIALDGLAVCVHPANPVENLTVEQIRDIYLGKITNWKEVGGLDKPIITIIRDAASGTYESFDKLVMGKDAKYDAPKKEEHPTNQQCLNRVQATEESIAYLGLSFAEAGDVKILDVNQVEPTLETVRSGEYPIARPLYMYTNGYPKLGSPLYKFVTFHMTRTGQKIVEEIGYIPLTNYQE